VSDDLEALEAELSPFVPETCGELLGVSYDPGDYERHSWSRRLRNARHGRPAQIAGYVRFGGVRSLSVMCAGAGTCCSRTSANCR
jgi:hypothetical protein